MTTPAGLISLALDAWMDTLADSATLQSWMGVSTQAAAKARIYRTALPVPHDRNYHTRIELQNLRPFVIACTDVQAGVTREIESVSDNFNLGQRGTVMALFEQDIDERISVDDAEIVLRAENQMGQIMDDVAALVGSAGYLSVHSLTSRGPMRSHPDDINEQGDFVTWSFQAQWRS